MFPMSSEQGERRKPSADSCFKPSILSFNIALNTSTSRLNAADCVRMAAVSARERVVISVRISDSAARKRYACYGHKVKKDQRSLGARGTYVVKIFVREPVAFNLSYAIDEQSTCCAHETACGLLGECLLEHAEEGMGVERWVLVG